MDLPPDSSRSTHASAGKDVPWFHALSRPILFLIATVALAGAYFAFSIPVAVFPNTDFPRIVVGVDNGVMPIDQMLVTITRPLEEAVNSVPEFQVSPDPARLLAAGITVTDILDAIRRTNLIDSPGLIESNHQLVLGLVSGQVRTPEQIGQIVVKNSPAGVPLRLGDIAKITPSVAPVYTIVTANGKPAVLLNVNRQPESNTLDVANEVHALIQELTPSLPPGVHLEPFYDQSTIVHDSIASVRDAVLIGLVLSAIILVLFHRDWGTSLVPGLVIPVTLLSPFSPLQFTVQTSHLITLGGLAAAVGLVIDDAIVVLHDIVLHRDAGQGRLVAIQSALRELTVPLIGSTVTPIVRFLPPLSTTGVTGSFFRALAVTMTVALLTSLLLALTWTPTLSQYLVRRKNGAESEVPPSGAGTDVAKLLAAEEAHLSGTFGRIVEFYANSMQDFVKRPWILVASSGAIIVLSFVCFSFLEPRR